MKKAVDFEVREDKETGECWQGHKVFHDLIKRKKMVYTFNTVWTTSQDQLAKEFLFHLKSIFWAVCYTREPDDSYMETVWTLIILVS